MAKTKNIFFFICPHCRAVQLPPFKSCWDCKTDLSSNLGKDCMPFCGESGWLKATVARQRERKRDRVDAHKCECGISKKEQAVARLIVGSILLGVIITYWSLGERSGDVFFAVFFFSIIVGTGWLLLAALLRKIEKIIPDHWLK